MLRFRYGPLVIRRNGSWVKSQLSDRGTTRIHIRLQWDTRVRYNVYELYCPLESIGQFGPSADPAIVAILHYYSRQLHRLQQISSKRVHYSSKYSINNIYVFGRFIKLYIKKKYKFIFINIL